MLTPELSQATDALLAAVKESDAYQAYAALKESVMADECHRALLKRYSAAQTALQMAALSGTEAREEDTAAFEQLSSLLYASPECTDYLLAKMRMQQLVADVMQRLTSGAEIDMEIPEV